MDSPKPYNPLDKKNLGISVADAMLEQPISALPPTAFAGAGIYAIYYSGNFEHYTAIREGNLNNLWTQPIYVGKAIPKGGRKGGIGLEATAGNVLHRRLTEHARSIHEAHNLELSDFYCRYLVVDDIWIPLGESLLIETFKPLWNVVLDGFGNHDPGGGRSNSQRSAWDMLHPGRNWASKYREGRDIDTLTELIRSHFNPER